jgi:hypothetical protein
MKKMLNKLKLYLLRRRAYSMATRNNIKFPIISDSGCLLFVEPSLPNTTVDRLRAVGGA